MRQVWIPRHGPPDVLEIREADDPRPDSGSVRIRVSCAGINFADVLARMGLYPDAPKTPCVVGYEVSGVIDAVGAGVDGARVGERVVATTRFGGYSDVVCVPASAAFPAPDALSDEEATGLPVNYLTAHLMLVHLGNVNADDAVLVHGAAGGVGVAAVQLCRIAGARIIGTASPPKHEFLRSQGVEPVDYRSPAWPDRVRALTDGRGVDIALDPIGGASFKRSYELLAPAGRLFCYGVADMAPGERRSVFRALRTLWATPRFHPIRLMNDNRAVCGVNLGHLWNEERLLAPQMEALLAHAVAGRIKPRIDRVFPFSEAADAHRYIQARKNVGKVLLRP